MPRKSEFLSDNGEVLSQIISNEEDNGSIHTLTLKCQFENLSELIDDAEKSKAQVVTIRGEPDKNVSLSEAKVMKARCKALLQTKINQFNRVQGEDSLQLATA